MSFQTKTHSPFGRGLGVRAYEFQFLNCSGYFFARHFPKGRGVRADAIKHLPLPLEKKGLRTRLPSRKWDLNAYSQTEKQFLKTALRGFHIDRISRDYPIQLNRTSASAVAGLAFQSIWKLFQIARP